MFEEGQLLVYIPKGTVSNIVVVGSRWIEIQDLHTRETVRVLEEEYHNYRAYEGGR